MPSNRLTKSEPALSRFARYSVVAAGIALAVAAATLSNDDAQAQAPRPATRVPVFEADPSWPKLPNNWVVGHVASVAVDRNDRVFMLHRPNTVPEAQRKSAAPPVLEFDASGAFVNAWGGQGQGYDWPDSEHGIAVDYKNNVWIGGSAPVAPSLRNLDDDMLLKFDSKGKFLLQIGGRTTSKGNADTKSVHQSADVFVWPKTNEAFVADGYGNRRVIVFDADTGAFKRMWGAYGKPPSDDKMPPYKPDAKLSEQFANPVHCVRLSNDGLVYVCDRANNRIQVFRKDGSFVKEFRVSAATLQSGSVWDLVLSEDPQQKFMFVADGANGNIVTLDRDSGKELAKWGRHGRQPGQFKWIHNIAIDSRGNLYTAEVGFGRRAQKFRRTP
jgi:hypothetical protein